MTHYLDLLPLDEGGRLLACWLDRPVAAVVLACACGWHGDVLPLSDAELHTFYGEPRTEEEFQALQERWEVIHAAAIVPAVTDLREARDVLAELAGSESPHAGRAASAALSSRT